MPILVAAIFCTLFVAVQIASIAIAIVRLRHKAPPRPGGYPPVSLVRPLCGLDNYATETLRSTFELDHPRCEILFCVAAANDAVVPLVKDLIAAHPVVDARLLIGDERLSANPKLNNVVKGWRAATHDWIVIADSNVLMPHDYIGRLFASWRADTGLVASPPIGSQPRGFWAEIECAFLNTYQARWQLFADAVGVGFAQGKSMLWRRDLLEKAGGIRTLAAEIAEDAAATKLVRRQGLRVHLVDRPFEQPLGRRTAAECWHRQLRWARLRRGTFPLLFAFEIFAGVLPPLAACALWTAAIEGPVISMTAAFATGWFAVEALLAHVARWHMSWRALVLLILRDLVLPVLWLASWMGNDFVWRDNQMGLVDRSSAA